MDNGAQIDLHAAGVVLRKTRPFNITIPICLLHSACIAMKSSNV